LADIDRIAGPAVHARPNLFCLFAVPEPSLLAMNPAITATEQIGKKEHGTTPGSTTTEGGEDAKDGSPSTAATIDRPDPAWYAAEEA
jgi:hypothetical protein